MNGLLSESVVVSTLVVVNVDDEVPEKPCRKDSDALL